MFGEAAQDLVEGLVTRGNALGGLFEGGAGLIGPTQAREGDAFDEVEGGGQCGRVGLVQVAVVLK